MALLELVVVIALMGLLTIAFGSISYNVIYRTRDNSGHVTAASGMESAVNWITNDGQGSQNTTLIPGAAAVGSLTLSWTDPATGDFHTILYFLSGTDLRRRESINSVVQTERTVVQHTTAVGFSQSVNDIRSFQVSLTASGGSIRVNETREYNVTLRAMD
jgi:hypothetical protein